VLWVPPTRVWPIYLLLAIVGLVLAIIYQTPVPIPVILMSGAVCAVAVVQRRPPDRQ
jgi:hypothetical protein